MNRPGQTFRFPSWIIVGFSAPKMMLTAAATATFPHTLWEAESKLGAVLGHVLGVVLGAEDGFELELGWALGEALGVVLGVVLGAEDGLELELGWALG
jgi:hypothetical protein